MVEQEERRIEALRKRQEKELNKIVEREQTMAQLQQKIKRAEEEEVKKKVRAKSFFPPTSPYSWSFRNYMKRKLQR